MRGPETIVPLKHHHIYPHLPLHNIGIDVSRPLRSSFFFQLVTHKCSRWLVRVRPSAIRLPPFHHLRRPLVFSGRRVDTHAGPGDTSSFFLLPGTRPLLLPPHDIVPAARRQRSCCMNKTSVRLFLLPNKKNWSSKIWTDRWLHDQSLLQIAPALTSRVSKRT